MRGLAGLGMSVWAIKWSGEAGNTNELSFEKAVNERFCDALEARGWAWVTV